MDDKELTLTLLASEVNVALAALQEMPFRISAPVIAKIKAQGDEQMRPPEPVEEN